MLLTVADISTVLTTPKMYNEFYGIILEDHLVLHKINSKGLFKKEFFMDDETHRLMFNKFQKAEFGKGNMIIWLQCEYDNGDLVFTSNWKSDSSKEFVGKLSKELPIENIELLK